MSSEHIKRALAQRASLIKRGGAMFEGTDYPRSWDDYVGQDEAKAFLRAAAASAKARGSRMDHVLIASGTPGIGKSALVRLVAQELGVGIAELQGTVDVSDAVRTLQAMQDGDILFLDEVHNIVASGRAKAEWLLSFLQDGVVITTNGVVAVPAVTVIAATTDAQRLPEAILSRFTIKPVLDSYTPEQAGQIFDVAARAVFGSCNMAAPGDANREAIVRAANCNPREILRLLKILRDSSLARGLSGNAYPMDQMFSWTRLTPDGLDEVAQRYLTTLYTAPQFTLGEKTLAQSLGEPTPPRWTEKLLVQKGYVNIGPKGRALTPDGTARAAELVEELV